jgi:hypothetical protein
VYIYAQINIHVFWTILGLWRWFWPNLSQFLANQITSKNLGLTCPNMEYTIYLHYLGIVNGMEGICPKPIMQLERQCKN